MEERKSAVGNVGVNYQYILNYRLVSKPNETSVLPPSTKAMHWCMMATRINRIFSEEDLNEFLFRLPIALHSLNLLDNWITYDHLMNYKTSDTILTFSTRDIISHFGIEVSDSVNNFISRDTFLSEFESHLTKIMLIGLFSGVEVLPFKTDLLSETIIIEKPSIAHLIDEKMIKDAEFFAVDVLSMAPKDLYDNQDRFKDKLLEIERRKAIIANRPKFNLKAIPADIRDQCMEMMFDTEWVADSRLNAPDDYEDLANKYIYLAWLFANDLMISDGVMADPVEGVDLDPMNYEFEDGGFNLLQTYDDNNFEAVKPLLKGLLF